MKLSPSSRRGCLICGTSEGTFVRVRARNARVETANGVKTTDTDLYLCAGHDKREGCVVQMGRLLGMRTAGECVELERRIRTFETEAAGLRHQIGELEARPTVRVMQEQDVRQVLAEAIRG